VKPAIDRVMEIEKIYRDSPTRIHLEAFGQNPREEVARVFDADRAEHVREIREAIEAAKESWLAYTGISADDVLGTYHRTRQRILDLPCLQLPKPEPASRCGEGQWDPWLSRCVFAKGHLDITTSHRHVKQKGPPFAFCRGTTKAGTHGKPNLSRPRKRWRRHAKSLVAFVWSW
jgi:hypothetical protein